MDSNLRKDLIFNQKNKTQIRQTKSLDVGFYNMDVDTAKLSFRVIYDDKPVLLGSRNVTCFAFLESTNGSNSGVLELEHEDAMKGVLSLKVPKDFLRDATNTTVTGQVYISVDGKEATMALDEFEFEVKDALINRITGEEKVKTIRMFYELREAVEQQVKNLTFKIDNINTTVDNKINNFNLAFEENKNKLQEDFDFYNNSLSEDYKSLDESIKSQKEKIETIYQNSLSNIEGNKNQFYSDLNSKFNEAKSEIESLTSELRTNIEESKGIRLEDIDGKINNNNNNLDWQKYKLTEDTGNRIYLGELNQRIETLKTGLYECVIPADANFVNAPEEKSGNSYVAEINVTTGTNGRKQILLIQNQTSSVWFKAIDINNVDLGWFPIIEEKYDTNWRKIPLKNGALELGGSYPESQYRIVKESGLRKAYIRLYVKNIVSGTVIATVPPEITSSPHFLSGISKVNKSSCRVTVSPSGDITFYKNLDDTWNENDYIIVEDNWLVD